MRIKSFSIKNYRSFNEEETLSFNDDLEHVSLIFGPNGSGKTNFFKALKFFCDFIHNSTHFIANPSSFYEPFLLKDNEKSRSTVFKIIIEGDSEREFKYYFSLLEGKVSDEGLSLKPKSSESFNTIFRRKSIRNGEYERNGFSKDLANSTRDDSLLLTRAYETNNKIATEFFDYLNKIKLIDYDTQINNSSLTSKRVLEADDFKEKVLSFLKQSDLFIQDIDVKKSRIPDEVFNSLPLKDEFMRGFDRMGYEVSTSHYIRDAEGKVIGLKKFDLQHHESSGAKRLYEVSAFIIDALEKGETIYIDDFDSNLHPKECEYIVSLFKGGQNRAHLIVNTHCTSLMDVVDRKNIYLFGKNYLEETEIGDISSEARNKNLQKKYSLGMFGGVPRVTIR